MAKTSLSSFLENIQPRRWPSLSRVITDAQLLKRFLKVQDESAFELLMWRHGPMGWPARQVPSVSMNPSEAGCAWSLTALPSRPRRGTRVGANGSDN
jgi:hypothetical protein